MAEETGFSLDNDPTWFKDAIIYQLHVRAYCDGQDDGIGDFVGLTQKLDYLQDLGVTALWLQPFYPSPLKDDGYDIADYTGVHANYGTLRDFQTFLNEAHRRGLRVITELVLNHTSDQHPWFQRARRAPAGSPLRDFYVWSDTPEKWKDARIIFKDFEISNWSWDPVAGAYYWHRFYAHQPDLNYDNPEVCKAMFALLDFWLGMGVDGLRLDAVPYLFEREGTTCENLPETHELLKRLRKHIDERFPSRMVLAEANQWPEDAVAYFGDGDECHMAFHFPLMPRMFMAVRMEDRLPILDILAQTPAIPDNCHWAIFLRNHDELTLEMVTDEERDYMYRSYARDAQARINLGIRRRLAPLLENNRRRIELLNSLLFSMPGAPVVYYGDEIGMGDNIYLGDRNGVRTPMQWSADRNAGFSRANPQRLYQPVIIDAEYHYEALNVEAQQNNPSSLLWWMKRLIALRKRYRAFSRGSLEFLLPANVKVLAFLRRFEQETILVVANLARTPQYVELDLGAFAGSTPVELLGGTPFPPVTERPYLLTLGPHSFYWFALEPQPSTDGEAPSRQSPVPVVSAPSAEGLFRVRGNTALENALAGYLRARHWFGRADRQVGTVTVQDVLSVPHADRVVHLVLARLEYTDGEPDFWALPLALAPEDEAADLLESAPRAVLAYLRGGARGVLHDALERPRFGEGLLDLVRRKVVLRGSAGEMVAWPSDQFEALRGAEDAPLTPVLGESQGNSTFLVYGDRLALKFFRRMEEGVNCDLEMTRFLAEKARFTHIQPLAGALEYRPHRGEPMTVAMLLGQVAGGNAWQFTLDHLSRYFEKALATRPEETHTPISTRALLELTEKEPPSLALELIDTYLEAARLLGQRTAELHQALASAADDPVFAPEPFTPHYQRSIYQSMRNLTRRAFRALRRSRSAVPEAVREHARRVLDLEEGILRRNSAVLHGRITTSRIRCHGDYHLGNLLYTGKDFVITNFEGDLSQSGGERRIKRSPLRDVAAMLRSFYYAAHQVRFKQVGGIVVRPADLPLLEPWARYWYLWVGTMFLRAYLAAASENAFLPRTHPELEVLLDSFLMEKTIHELGHELHDRPEWLEIPLRSLLELTEATEPA
ncbi:MAG: maltose alpha-D-glucosyltransferase [Gemmataceae bacterium]|nr:maltose alpha-D-glucosyltransferase [Gemmataceae bacterium]